MGPSNQNNRCVKELGLEKSRVPELLHKCSSIMETQLDLVGGLAADSTTLEYDNISGSRQLHLLDHISNTRLPDYDTLSLEHQLAVVLDIIWGLQLTVRPLLVFNSQEVECEALMHCNVVQIHNIAFIVFHI